MIRQLPLFALFILSGFNSIAQRPFSNDSFETNLQIAKYLVEYYEVANRTSDTLMDLANRNEGERLGKDWFCFKDEKEIWHAVYGKYYLGEFDQVFHLTVDKQRRLQRSKVLLDSGLVNSYARALRTAGLCFRDLNDSSGIYFDRFVHKEPDGNLRVWMLAVLQPNGVAVSGRSYSFTLDPMGNNILGMTNTNREQIITYNISIPTEIWVNNLRHSEPGIPSLFLAWYYRDNFKRIHIESRNMVSSLIKESDGTFRWVHLVPPPQEKKKKKKN